MTIRLALILAGVVGVAACGGGGTSPTSPTPTTTTTPPATTAPPVATTPQPPANFGVYMFSFDAGTSASDQAIIGDATQIANDFFTETYSRTLTTPTQIKGVVSAAGCNQGGSAAFTGAGSVTFCLANQGWTALGPTTRRKVVVHELYHVLQFERHWLGTAQTGPDWIVEGAAELVGYKAIDHRGLLAYSTAQGCQVKEFTDFGVQRPPGLPNLNALESHQQWQTTQGPLYALAMTGMDQLVSRSGIGSFNTYMDAIAGGTPFPAAFQAAFGMTSAAFYDQFPAYRAALTVPPNYLCGGV
jgi:hypothetical protein